MQIQGFTMRRYLVAWGLFLILIFFLLDPNSTQALSPLGSLAAWAFNVGFLLALLAYCQKQFYRFNPFKIVNPWLQLMTVALVAVGLFLPLALGFDYLMGLDDWNQVKGIHSIFSLLGWEYVKIAPLVTLCWLIINAPFILNLQFALAAQPAATPQPRQPPRTAQPLTVEHGHNTLFSKLPSALGQDIIYLMAELHYTRVVTTTGQALILYNFSEAIKEVARRQRGVQTHRSYWVAGDHVLKVLSREVVLTNQWRVPISRRKRSQLKAFLRTVA
ncbi:MAG: LytTR family transcriptional regulator DNA-binding domain-containing protein [Alphaproteobacteria bacterium]|nr:LytTR family transcriptional regulator DNA-binding domain-containing protein [Alphaproteobacteria bacterium]